MFSGFCYDILTLDPTTRRCILAKELVKSGAPLGSFQGPFQFGFIQDKREGTVKGLGFSLDAENSFHAIELLLIELEMLVPHHGDTRERALGQWRYIIVFK